MGRATGSSSQPKQRTCLGALPRAQKRATLMPFQAGVGGDCCPDERKDMYDLARYRPFMVVFSMWFMLVCGCVGDPSLLLSTGTAGSQPVA